MALLAAGLETALGRSVELGLALVMETGRIAQRGSENETRRGQLGQYPGNPQYAHPGQGRLAPEDHSPFAAADGGRATR